MLVGSIVNVETVVSEESAAGGMTPALMKLVSLWRRHFNPAKSANDDHNSGVQAGAVEFTYARVGVLGRRNDDVRCAPGMYAYGCIYPHISGVVYICVRTWGRMGMRYSCALSEERCWSFGGACCWYMLCCGVAIPL